MSRLSILIAMTHEPKRLEQTLVSVLENRPADCEVIVVHDGSYRDPYELDGEVCFVAAPANATELEMLRLGLHAAHAPIVHLLECGAEVGPDWSDEAVQLFDDPQTASVVPVAIDADHPDQLVSLGIEYLDGGMRRLRGSRQRWPDDSWAAHAPVGPSLSAAFYRRETLVLVGGLDTTVGAGWADVDIALGLRAAGYHALLATRSIVRLPATARRREDGITQGKCAERVFWRHAGTVGWLRSLWAHPFAWAAEFLAELTGGRPMGTTLGRVLGLSTVTSDFRYRQWLRRQFDPTRKERTSPETGQLRIDDAHDRAARVGEPMARRRVA